MQFHGPDKPTVRVAEAQFQAPDEPTIGIVDVMAAIDTIQSLRV